MAEKNQPPKKHFLLGNLADPEPFSPPRRSISPVSIPARERQSHGNHLLRQVEQLKPAMQNAKEVQEAAGLDKDGLGLRLEFESFDDIDLAIESLARERSGIELLNVRRDENITFATVFVPDGKLLHFEKLVTDYLGERRDRKGNLRDNSSLVNTIKEIRAASLRELWTDDESEFPRQDDEVFWWEVWLPVRKDRQKVVETFRFLAEAQEISLSSSMLEFPERTVLLAYASRKKMQQSMMTLNSIAELRRAKETAEVFDSLSPEQQPEWIEELMSRCEYSAEGEGVPYVCLLDTGVNNGHPLIFHALADSDLHTVQPTWGLDDQAGHGTSMAGLALFGNLTEPLLSSLPINIRHRIESVKIIPHDNANHGEAYLHGYLTKEAVNRTIITDAFRKRVYGMAVSARDNRDRGRPSAWSSAVDSLAVDAEGENEIPRLMILCAGNIDDLNAWREYPASNSSDGIHDPGQAWNALTVGAHTNLVHITEEDADNYTPIAPTGGISPFSTTSSTWQNHWPIKPDVVFEGGNAADDGISPAWMPSLSLLSTHHKPHERLLTTMNATSAATALACRMAAQLIAVYPQLWPETIRALIVHSAQWTDAMLQTYLPVGKKANKGDYNHLIRHCGFGAPDLDRALWSVSNSLTMVIETDLYPFKKEDGKEPSLRDMNLHRLPWPLDELESLGEIEVEMRVTLSYFIEPNPSTRGVRTRYRYESHGLRFDVKRPHESKHDFRGRINSLAINADEGSSSAGDDTKWLIGPQNRHKGSLHSDVWRGPAAELASRGVLAVYPTLGWWKTRTSLARYNKKARYALIISIHAPETEIDLYTAVENQIGVPITIGTV
ncbi:MAG: S8 family peptidase [Deltaproteobacteria bacterium]|nr:S8 family peptidase [Deltaproteobacteria bacterium]